MSPDKELLRELEVTKVPDAHTRPGILPFQPARRKSLKIHGALIRLHRGLLAD